MSDMTTMPRWRQFRAMREPGDRPHHVANRILRAYGVKGPEVPVEAIARWLGVQIEKRSNPGWDGAADTTKGRAIVWVNSSTAPTRQRFTLAHELGHALLHEEGVLFRDATFAPAGNRKERDANDFAAALLIPLWMLEPIVMARRHSTTDLAALFDVSPGAMGIQLEKLL